MIRLLAPRRLLMSGLILLLALPALYLGGCYSNDTVNPERDLPPPPVLTAEPAFSPGYENTVSWSLDKGDPTESLNWEFQAQRSGNSEFLDDVAESLWISDMSYRFTDLEHGSLNYFRVRGRTPGGRVTEWSGNQASTQDAVPPAAAVMTELKEEQTSLLFTFEVSADDETSGISEIEIWFGLQGEEGSLYGVFPVGTVSVQATGGGIHELTPVAVDGAGNRQEPGTATAFTTVVPEPIIITDRNYEDFDITAAVLEFRMAEQYWEFGLGRYSIPPVIDPLMIGPGHRDYPNDQNLVEILAVDYGGDNRAYKIGDMRNREVVDDVVNGIPIAVCY